MDIKSAIIKSLRHSKIIGDFSEHLILYFLSKYNYEPVLADYTGIDIIAYNKKGKNKIGISVSLGYEAWKGLMMEYL